MRRIAATLAVVGALLFSAGSAWADWDNGWAAYNRGDYAAALQEWRPLAEQGLAKAQYNLGLMYADGKGVPQNHAEAVKWYRKAAEQGDADAQAKLGKMYRTGKGVAKSRAIARSWYLKAAEQGSAEAQLWLSNLGGGGRYRSDWLRMAAEQGHVIAQHNLGMEYKRRRDAEEAEKWFRRAGEQGLALSFFTLGMMYHFGGVVEQDYETAANWYRAAVKLGHSGAKGNLSAIERGHKVEPRNVAPRQTYGEEMLERAEQGNSDDYYDMFMFYELGESVSNPRVKVGEGIQQNDIEAVKWLRKAAENGDKSAQFELGRRYHIGHVVPFDQRKAVKWLSMAAEQEMGKARRLLGVIYLLGSRNLQADHVEAVKWFRLEAKRGNTHGQYQLGNCYERGFGVPQDYVLAHIWFNLSASQNNESSSKRRTDLESKMTPEQIADAQRLAREWKPK